MRIGEICLETNDVIKMADFYRWLLSISESNCGGDSEEIPEGCKDEVHQTIIAEETMLTIYNNGQEKSNDNKNISLAFTVEDIYKYHEMLVERGITILEPPTVRPWGTINMSFLDPDNNAIYLRQFN